MSKSGTDEVEFDKDYRESEDEDFNPDAVAVNDSDDSDDDDLNTPSIAGTTSSVQTRSQRKIQPQEPAACVVGETSVDVDALWEEMNAPPNPRAPVAVASDAASDAARCVPSDKKVPALTSPAGSQEPRDLAEETIEIVRTFKFAGKVTTETKTVLKSSAEGQAFIRETKAGNNASGGGSTSDAKTDEVAKTKVSDQQTAESATAKPVGVRKRPGPAKRKLTLEQEYQLGKTKKINTLEKSQLDWLSFVDKEGIHDDLKKHNKDGYLEKQGFLARVEHTRDQDLRAHRQMANQRRP